MATKGVKSESTKRPASRKVDQHREPRSRQSVKHAVSADPVPRDAGLQPTGKPVQEALKEVARLALVAAASTAIGEIVGYLANMEQTPIVVVLFAAFKAIDKWIHENPNIKATGLIPF
jgi:hypothetical protein